MVISRMSELANTFLQIYLKVVLVKLLHESGINVERHLLPGIQAERHQHAQ
jgi:post-segregation antitoxin (ccd killing protein)